MKGPLLPLGACRQGLDGTGPGSEGPLLQRPRLVCQRWGPGPGSGRGGQGRGPGGYGGSRRDVKREMALAPVGRETNPSPTAPLGENEHVMVTLRRLGFGVLLGMGFSVGLGPGVRPERPGQGSRWLRRIEVGRPRGSPSRRYRHRLRAGPLQLPEGPRATPPPAQGVGSC